MFCKNCGAELPDDSLFCPKCGKEIKFNDSSFADKNNLEISRKDVKKTTNKKRLFLIIPFVAIILAITVAFLFLKTDIFKSVRDLCKEGKYQQAYEKSKSTNEQQEIIEENKISIMSFYVIDKVIKDDTFFKLKNVYERNSKYLLETKTKNAVGGIQDTYYLFRDNGSFEKAYTEKDLELQSENIEDYLITRDFAGVYSARDSLEEAYEHNNTAKELNNILGGKSKPQYICDDINNLFKKNKLKQIKEIRIND